MGRPIIILEEDQVYVVVTPYDGVEYGLPTPSSMRTPDPPMSSPEISVIGSPNDPPVEGEDDLVCLADTPVVDPDPEDPVEYIYNGFSRWNSKLGCSDVCRNR